MCEGSCVEPRCDMYAMRLGLGLRAYRPVLCTFHNESKDIPGAMKAPVPLVWLVSEPILCLQVPVRQSCKCLSVNLDQSCQLMWLSFPGQRSPREQVCWFPLCSAPRPTWDPVIFTNEQAHACV